MLIRGINLYDPDVYKIPEYNWQKFQRCLMMEAGIGSTTSDIIRRADMIATAVDNERKDDLANELMNLKLAMFSTAEGINYQSMAFACMVQDIDGQTYSIKTDADINTLSNVITETGVTHGEVEDYIESVKKKLIYN